VAQFLKDAPDRKIALQELAATLMATAEFRFNH
jgi:hypothetical protein